MSVLICGERMTRSEYDSIKAIRSTELKQAAKSLYHFNEYQKGNRDVSASQQKGWDMGTIAHSVCLENDSSALLVFDGRKPDGTEYAKPRASSAFKGMVSDNPDKIVVTEREFAELSDKKACFDRGIDVSDVMRGSEVERVFCAQDPITGLWLKCQVDIVNLKERRFADFKGVPDASEFGVGRMAARAKWPMQIGHYAYVIELASQIRMERFDFIAQETKRPFYTEAHELSQFDMETSSQAFRELLNRLSIAIKENEWPGYKKTGALVIPPWGYSFEEIEEDG